MKISLRTILCQVSTFMSVVWLTYILQKRKIVQFWLQVKLIDISHSVNPFSCTLFCPGLLQSLHCSTVMFKNLCRTIWRMTSRNLKLITQNFRKVKNSRHMALPMPRRLSPYSGLQKLMDLQIFNVDFEQAIECQDQRRLAKVDGTRTTSPRVVFRS